MSSPWSDPDDPPAAPKGTAPFSRPGEPSADDGEPSSQELGQSPPGPPAKRPLQFSLMSLFGLTLAVSMLFGTLRWLGVSPTASAVVLVILIVGMVAAVGLLAAIAKGE